MTSIIHRMNARRSCWCKAQAMTSSSYWWRWFPDSPKGGPTLSHQLAIAPTLLHALRQTRLTIPEHRPVDVKKLVLDEPTLKALPASWICYIIEEHLKCEYTLTCDGCLVYLKGCVPQDQPDPKTPPRPILRRKRGDNTTTVANSKRKVTLKQGGGRYCILPRTPEHDG